MFPLPLYAPGLGDELEVAAGQDKQAHEHLGQVERVDGASILDGHVLSDEIEPGVEGEEDCEGGCCDEGNVKGVADGHLRKGCLRGGARGRRAPPPPPGARSEERRRKSMAGEIRKRRRGWA